MTAPDPRLTKAAKRGLGATGVSSLAAFRAVTGRVPLPAPDLTETMLAVQDAAGQTFAAQVTGLGVAAPSDVALILSKESATRITHINAQTRAAVRQTLAEGFAKRLHPTEIARRLRGVIGLTPRQAQQVRALADRWKAQGLGAATIDKLIGRERQRRLAQRAEVIARTEAIAALEQARFRQTVAMAANGTLSSSMYVRQWVTAVDERTCPTCAPRNGWIAELTGPFKDGVYTPPLHPNCRCTVTTVLRGWTGVGPSGTLSMEAADAVEAEAYAFGEEGFIPFGETTNAIDDLLAAALDDTMLRSERAAETVLTAHLRTLGPSGNVVADLTSLRVVSEGPRWERAVAKVLPDIAHAKDVDGMALMGKKGASTVLKLAGDTTPEALRSVALHETAHHLDAVLTEAGAMPGSKRSLARWATAVDEARLALATDLDAIDLMPPQARGMATLYRNPTVGLSEWFADSYAYAKGAPEIRHLSRAAWAQAFPEMAKAAGPLVEQLESLPLARWGRAIEQAGGLTSRETTVGLQRGKKWDKTLLDVNDPMTWPVPVRLDPDAEAAWTHWAPNNRELRYITRQMQDYQYGVHELADRLERDALDYYKGSGYTDINYVLRGRTGPTPEAVRYIKRIDSYIGKNAIRLESDIYVWRGIKERGWTELLGSFDGQYLHDGGYFSTSFQVGTSHGFARGSHIGVVKLPKGTPVVLGVGGEYEVLVPRGGRFKLLGYMKNSESATGMSPVLELVDLKPLKIAGVAEPTIAARTVAEQKDLSIFGGLSPRQIFGTQTQGPGGVVNTGKSGMWTGTDGAKRYVKQYPNPDQTYTEHAVNRIYRELGFDVPESLITRQGDEVYYVSEWLDGASVLSESGSLSGTVKWTKDAATKALDGIVADVLMANYDAVGQANMMLGPYGQLIRVDQGGALLWRPRPGMLKPAKHLHDASALRSLAIVGEANPSPHADYAKLFRISGLTPDSDDLVRSIKHQIEQVLALHRRHGGWEEALRKYAPAMTPAHRAEAAAFMEARTAEFRAMLPELANRIAGMAPSNWKATVGTTIHQPLSLGGVTPPAPPAVKPPPFPWSAIADMASDMIQSGQAGGQTMGVVLDTLKAEWSQLPKKLTSQYQWQQLLGDLNLALKNVGAHAWPEEQVAEFVRVTMGAYKHKSDVTIMPKLAKKATEAWESTAKGVLAKNADKTSLGDIYHYLNNEMLVTGLDSTVVQAVNDVLYANYDDFVRALHAADSKQLHGLVREIAEAAMDYGVMSGSEVATLEKLTAQHIGKYIDTVDNALSTTVAPPPPSLTAGSTTLSPAQAAANIQSEDVMLAFKSALADQGFSPYMSQSVYNTIESSYPAELAKLAVGEVDALVGEIVDHYKNHAVTLAESAEAIMGAHSTGAAAPAGVLAPDIVKKITMDIANGVSYGLDQMGLSHYYTDIVAELIGKHYDVVKKLSPSQLEQLAKEIGTMHQATEALGVGNLPLTVAGQVSKIPAVDYAAAAVTDAEKFFADAFAAEGWFNKAIEKSMAKINDTYPSLLTSLTDPKDIQTFVLAVSEAANDSGSTLSAAVDKIAPSWVKTTGSATPSKVKAAIHRTMAGMGYETTSWYDSMITQWEAWATTPEGQKALVTLKKGKVPWTAYWGYLLQIEDFEGTAATVKAFGKAAEQLAGAKASSAAKKVATKATKKATSTPAKKAVKAPKPVSKAKVSTDPGAMFMATKVQGLDKYVAEAFDEWAIAEGAAMADKLVAKATPQVWKKFAETYMALATNPSNQYQSDNWLFAKAFNFIKGKLK